MDNPSRRGLARLMLRLPEHRADLRRLYVESLGFAGLCEAYELASDALAYWAKSAADGAVVADYRDLTAVIEKDVLFWIATRLSSAPVRGSAV